jgi:transposase
MGWSFEWKNVKGYRYLIIVEKKWTPKGPRNVRQIYLGSADNIHAKLTDPPRRLKSFPFGKSAALLYAARRTGLWEALQRHLPGDSSAAAWELLVQILARVEQPISREGMARWFPKSALPLLAPWTSPPSGRVLRASLRKLYDTGLETKDGPILSRARVRAIQEDVFRTLRAQGLEPRLLLFDGTNEFVHHKAGRWTRKGKSKARRYDKNLIGLGMVTLDTIPVLSEVFPGNRNDMDTFPEVFEALQKRLERLEVATEKLLLVVDRGVNSVENFDEILGAMHVVASLKRNEAKELFEIPIGRFRVVGHDTEGRPVLGHAGRWEGFEREWRVLVTYRPAEARHAEAQWERAKARVLPKVEEWRKGRPNAKQKVAMSKLVDLIPREYRGIFDYGVEELFVRDAKGAEVRRFRPRCSVDPRAEGELKVSFGKAAIITDLEPTELTDEQLLEDSVARSQIEEQFKWLKDRYVISIKPVWVWSDAALPGHVFLCVMGLTLLRYLQWEAKDLHLSVKELVERLGRIRVAIVTDEGRPGWVLEEMGIAEAELASRFKLLEQMPRETTATA